MKLKKMLSILGLSAVMVSSVSIPTFAETTTNPAVIVNEDKFVESRDLYEIKTIQKDSFIVRENRFGESDNYSKYTIDAKLDKAYGRPAMFFTVITEEGSSLGKLENSQNIIDSKEDLGNGRTKYTFHNTLFGYKPTRIVNINVTGLK